MVWKIDLGSVKDFLANEGIPSFFLVFNGWDFTRHWEFFYS